MQKVVGSRGVGGGLLMTFSQGIEVAALGATVVNSQQGPEETLRSERAGLRHCGHFKVVGAYPQLPE